MSGTDDEISKLMRAEGISFPEAVERLAADRGNDVKSLADIDDVVDALGRAVAALRIGNREAFFFEVGFARGRLSRVSQRIYDAGESGERH